MSLRIVLSSPDPVSGQLFTIIRVLDKSGNILQTCTATNTFLDMTIDTLSSQFSINEVIDEREKTQ